MMLCFECPILRLRVVVRCVYIRFSFDSLPLLCRVSQLFAFVSANTNKHSSKAPHLTSRLVQRHRKRQYHTTDAKCSGRNEVDSNISSDPMQWPRSCILTIVVSWWLRLISNEIIIDMIQIEQEILQQEVLRKVGVWLQTERNKVESIKTYYVGPNRLGRFVGGTNVGAKFLNVISCFANWVGVCIDDIDSIHRLAAVVCRTFFHQTFSWFLRYHLSSFRFFPFIPVAHRYTWLLTRWTWKQMVEKKRNSRSDQCILMEYRNISETIFLKKKGERKEK